MPATYNSLEQDSLESRRIKTPIPTKASKSEASRVLQYVKVVLPFDKDPVVRSFNLGQVRFKVEMARQLLHGGRNKLL